MPLVVALFFAALMGFYMVPQAVQSVRTAGSAQEDAATVSVWAYLNALRAYRSANLSVTGTISDSVITMPAGMPRNPNWTNVIHDGRLWVYEVTPLNPRGVLARLSEREAANGVFVGRRSGASLTTYKGYSTGISFPATVPVGSIVMVTR